jgi:mRNA-degrading endonuclease YafQ of YafQ-DinJ toxin-antitoxin module
MIKFYLKKDNFEIEIYYHPLLFSYESFFGFSILPIYIVIYLISDESLTLVRICSH